MRFKMSTSAKACTGTFLQGLPIRIIFTAPGLPSHRHTHTRTHTLHWDTHSHAPTRTPGGAHASAHPSKKPPYPQNTLAFQDSQLQRRTRN